MRVVHWMVAVCFFTASCDVVLNLKIGGSLRLCQFLMMLVIFAAMGHAIQNGHVLWGRGCTSLAVWMVVQLVLLPLCGVISIGLEFYGLLLFTVVGVFAMIQLYGNSNRIESLMRYYMLSYVFIASFGLLQFALPLVHLPSILVQQWIVHGRVARISAFSYEPSYFATYLMIGWVMLVDLRISRAKIAAGPRWKWATAIVTAALFLSSSKTAWVFMLLEVFSRIFPGAWLGIRRFLRDFMDGRVLIRLPSKLFLVNSIIVLFALSSAILVLSRYIPDFGIFLSGSGLGHQPAHSLNDRNNAVVTTFEAFKEHPFVGRSLGGVPIYIASRGGIEVHNMEEVRHFWGFPVLLDVLVASGLFGFIPFLTFLYTNTIGAYRAALRYWPEERAKWLRALSRAMIFEWLVLMTDQNLLRVYLWFHFSIVAAVAYHLEFSPVPVPVVDPPLMQFVGQEA
jgi:hypothetical protein